MSPHWVQKVVLTGGSSHIPYLKNVIHSKFTPEAITESSAFPPELAVIHGTILRTAPIQVRTSSPTSLKRKLDGQESLAVVKRTKESPDEGPVIGIDLGTTYSCVGVWTRGNVHIIEDKLTGRKTLPSVVAFKHNAVTGLTHLVGQEAKHHSYFEPQHVVFEAKRLIGRKFADAVVQEDSANRQFKIVDDNSKLKIECEFNGTKQRFYPEEISAKVLSKLKAMADEFTGEKVTKAVITVPAYFNNLQRTSTKEAAKIAGLEVLKIINEPTAAAVAYGLDYTDDKEHNILVYDLGGGTFDVSVLSVKNQEFTVKATAGDTHLGGADFDARLVDHFKSRFQEKHGFDLTPNKRAMTRLRFACEKAKIKLSQCMEARIEMCNLHAGITYEDTITRSEFEGLCTDLFQITIALLENAIEDSGLQTTDIGDVVLVGGSTRIPKGHDSLQ